MEYNYIYFKLWFIPIKIIRGISDNPQIALSVQKGHVKCTVARREAYRPLIFVLNFNLV